MLSERTRALPPVSLSCALSSPTCGKPFASGVNRSQLRNNLPQGLLSASRIMRFALNGYQKLSWYTTLAMYAHGASTVFSDHSIGFFIGPQ